MKLKELCYRFFICSNIYTLMIVYLSIIACLLLFSVKNTTALTSIILSFIGLLTWSLVEYSVHRFLFHGERRSTLLKKLQFFMHGYHHISPRDPDRLVLPFIITLPITIVSYVALLFFLSIYAYGLLAGFLMGYIIYDTSHYMIHRLQPNTMLGKYRRSYHYHHHFRNQTQCFGVSSPLWDYIFNTQWRRDQG